MQNTYYICLNKYIYILYYIIKLSPPPSPLLFPLSFSSNYAAFISFPLHFPFSLFLLTTEALSVCPENNSKRQPCFCVFLIFLCGNRSPASLFFFFSVVFSSLISLFYICSKFMKIK